MCSCLAGGRPQRQEIAEKDGGTHRACMGARQVSQSTRHTALPREAHYAMLSAPRWQASTMTTKLRLHALEAGSANRCSSQPAFSKIRRTRQAVVAQVEVPQAAQGGQHWGRQGAPEPHARQMERSDGPLLLCARGKGESA